MFRSKKPPCQPEPPKVYYFPAYTYDDDSIPIGTYVAEFRQHDATLLAKNKVPRDDVGSYDLESHYLTSKGNYLRVIERPWSNTSTEFHILSKEQMLKMLCDVAYSRNRYLTTEGWTVLTKNTIVV